MDSMKSRLKAFVRYSGLGETAFEKKTGLSNGLISNAGEGISSKSINKITLHYPELNTAWLIKGKGEMLLTDEKSHMSSGGVLRTLKDYVELLESRDKEKEADKEFFKELLRTGLIKIDASLNELLERKLTEESTEDSSQKIVDGDEKLNVENN